MNVEQLKALLEDEDYLDDIEGITIIEEGEQIAEGKWCFLTTIVQDMKGNYFEIVQSRSNSGYWSDSEKGETSVQQVKPVKKIVETTEWVAV